MSDDQTIQLENQDQFTECPPRRFVPVCVRREHGFACGPAGYVESDDAESPIVIKANERKVAHDDQRNV